MPIVINSGGGIGLPMCTLKSGATMVDPGVWAKARKHPAVKHHLQTGRLAVKREGAVERPDHPPNQQPSPPPKPEQVEIPIATDQGAVIDLGTVSAKEAIEIIPTLSENRIELELARETRKTVIAALEDRKLEFLVVEE